MLFRVLFQVQVLEELEAGLFMWSIWKKPLTTQVILYITYIESLWIKFIRHS